MIRRREFGMAGFSMLALAAVEGSAFTKGAKGAAAADHSHHDEMMQACAKACSACQNACDMCSTHCARMLADGHKEHATTLGTCQDCADFCSAAAQIVARGGPFAHLICAACAEACAGCAKECAKFPDDAHMKACADECRACEKACREMVMHK